MNTGLYVLFLLVWILGVQLGLTFTFVLGKRWLFAATIVWMFAPWVALGAWRGCLVA